MADTRSPAPKAPEHPKPGFSQPPIVFEHDKQRYCALMGKDIKACLEYLNFAACAVTDEPPMCPVYSTLPKPSQGRGPAKHL